MHHWTPTSKHGDDANPPVRVTGPDGTDVPVRLRLLGYGGCEFEADREFTPGEQVAIHIYRMGQIRARVLSSEGRIVEVEFVQECPV